MSVGRPRRAASDVDPRQVGSLAPVDRDVVAAEPQLAAPGLLGAVVVRRHDDGRTSLARIVETEAYGPDDPASHSYRGQTPRTRSMFAAPGTAYVYRSYGIHWCLNVAVEDMGVGAAVLVRAAVVLDGLEDARRRRGHPPDRDLARGPGRLCVALDIDGPRHDGIDLVDPTNDLWLASDGWAPTEVATGPRVGIRLAAQVPWRFYLPGWPEVSQYRQGGRPARRRAH